MADSHMGRRDFMRHSAASVVLAPSANAALGGDLMKWNRMACLLACIVFGTTHLMADSAILMEAEAFQDKGGWVVGPQFMDPMGSPFLLAHGLDQKVTKVLKRLEEDGLADNTIVVFMGDHGRPMTRGKTMLYDSGMQIPLILRWPNGIEAPSQYEAGRTYEELISGIDLTATSLAFAGVEKPAKMQGRVFMGPNAESPRKYVHAAADRIGEFHHRIRCVRGRRYKYIRNYNDTPINEQATAYRKAMHPIHHLLNKLGRENRLTPAQQALIEHFQQYGKTSGARSAEKRNTLEAEVEREDEAYKASRE